MDDFIKIDNVEKLFEAENGHSVRALDKVNLTIKENEFICILGPSGCGKSTLLRIISGLDSSTHQAMFYLRAMFNPEYARLTAELLNELEQMNI